MTFSWAAFVVLAGASEDALFRDSVRPLLVAISSLPIIPISWRTAMHLFVAALDALAARGAAGDFKAGKDL